ncbi:hypothetical protein Mapa_015228 [Marchantia paleacea]|nr:hypothetical protein Mapa_015228 [Marchantia paleacea]
MTFEKILNPNNHARRINSLRLEIFHHLQKFVVLIFVILKHVFHRLQICQSIIRRKARLRDVVVRCWQGCFRCRRFSSVPCHSLHLRGRSPFLPRPLHPPSPFRNTAHFYHVTTPAALLGISEPCRCSTPDSHVQSKYCTAPPSSMRQRLTHCQLNSRTLLLLHPKLLCTLCIHNGLDPEHDDF